MLLWKSRSLHTFDSPTAMVEVTLSNIYDSLGIIVFDKTLKLLNFCRFVTIGTGDCVSLNIFVTVIQLKLVLKQDASVLWILGHEILCSAEKSVFSDTFAWKLGHHHLAITLFDITFEAHNSWWKWKWHLDKILGRNGVVTVIVSTLSRYHDRYVNFQFGVISS